MKKKVALYLLVFGIILILPLFQNHHIQIDNSTDIVAHTAVIQAILDGSTMPFILYMGELIVGYPLALIVKLSGMSVYNVYIWFNYLALIGAAFSLFFVTRKLVGKSASYLSIPITMFCSVSILAMFTSGIIFNIINMYIILPWALYFIVKWVTQNRIVHLLSSVAMLGVFFVFHASGMYLPFAIGLFFGGSLIYRLIIGRYNEFKPIMILCVPMIIIGACLSIKFLPLLQYINVLGMDYDAVNLWQFIKYYLGFITTGLFCLAVYGYFTLRHEVKIRTDTILFSSLILCFIAPLSVGIILNISASSVRMSLDCASLLALLIACTLGIILDIKKHGWFYDVVYYIAVSGVGIALFAWLRGG